MKYIFFLAVFIDVYLALCDSIENEAINSMRHKHGRINNRIYIPIFRRGIDVFHSRKFMNKIPDKEDNRVESYTEKVYSTKYYRFSGVGPDSPREGMLRLSIPDSKYFPSDVNKPKIVTGRKQVESGIFVRHKRSVQGSKSKKKESHRTNHQRKQRVPKAQDTRRLIAARDARIEDYPYVISIQKDNEHWCSGALLHQRLAITTANCLWKSNQISRMMVRAGSRYTNKGGQLAKISQVARHPLWSIRKKPDHDIALILLDRDLRFSNSLHAVDLPNRGMSPAFEDFWVTSYGAERRDGLYENKATTLQVYHSNLMDREECNNVTKMFGVSVTPNFLCITQNSKRAPCTRDTGAPAVSDGVVWGLASWSIRKLCGTEKYPAMFSYVASNDNINFIINASTMLMSEQRFSPYIDSYRFNEGTDKVEVARPITEEALLDYK